MRSFEEKVKNMPRVKAEAGEMVVIETTYEGVKVHEAVCYVEGLEIKKGATRVKLCVFDPSNGSMFPKTEYEL